MTTDKNGDREIRKRARKELEQAWEELKRAEKLAEQNARKIEQETEEQRKTEAYRAKAEEKALTRLNSGIKDGKARLLVRAPDGSQQLNDFEKRLVQAEGLKIDWTGGSKEEGSVIMLRGRDPLTIARALKATPGVGDLKVQGGNILVTLN